MPLARIVFVLLYLVVDVIYVTLSRNAYESVVKRIQNKGFPGMSVSRLSAAAFAYISLAIGWMFLVAPVIESEVKSQIDLIYVGGFYGAIYALAVYGVFNGTLHVMFEQYDGKIMLRDMIWGLSCITIFSILYAWYVLRLRQK